jgi:hypothetical protein
VIAKLFANAFSMLVSIVDRKDSVLNLIEMKFSDKEFKVSKGYEKELQNKLSEYQAAYLFTKLTWFVLMTTPLLSTCYFYENPG